MGWTTQTGNYVKFLRGTPEAWAALANPNDDTLYFICENGANVEAGKLYLGNKLISDGNVTSISSLEDLDDVLISSGISNNSLLIYDSTAHKWKPAGLNAIFQLMISPMVGATANSAGDQGLVPAPQAGDQNKFLRGDATWVNPTAAVEAILNTLVGTDTNKSIRTIAQEETAKIVDGAPAAFDTLKEIAAWIANNHNASDIIALDNRVDSLEDEIFGTFDENDNRLTDGLIIEVGNLTTNYNNLSTTVNQIQQTVKWQDMIYQIDEG